MQILTTFYSSEEFYGSQSEYAYDLLETALAGSNDSTTFAAFHGDALMRQGKHAEAAKQFRLSLTADSSKYEIWEALLVSELSSGTDTAMLGCDARRASRLFPLHPLPYYMQAIVEHDNERYSEAVGLLKKCGLGYTKIDYNDCIGTGCDDPDSLGEGLRQNMQGTLEFFRRMRKEIPEIWIENCSSGGHRLEPSLMGVSDMASFSDAHECAEIPIIAANLHRMILPAQSQIWAVLRAEDSIRRINYSLINTFLGVMCLSGDVIHLSAEQWRKAEEGMAFYRQVRHIIRDGVSSFFGEISASWRHPEGWQAVVRRAGNETLAVIHTFGGGFPEKITLPVQDAGIRSVMCSENNAVILEDGKLTVELKAPFEAVAVYLG